MKYSTATTLFLLLIRIIKCLLKNGIIGKSFEKEFKQQREGSLAPGPRSKIPIIFSTDNAR